MNKDQGLCCRTQQRYKNAMSFLPSHSNSETVNNNRHVIAMTKQAPASFFSFITSSSVVECAAKLAYFLEPSVASLTL